MFGKMYVASVEQTREGDKITLSPIPVLAKGRSEEPPPATQMPEGERPAVYGGGTGSLGTFDDRPTPPDETLKLTGDLSFFAPPSATGTTKSGQVYLLSLTPSEGETIPVEEAEGAKKRKQPDNHSRH